MEGPEGPLFAAVATRVDDTVVVRLRGELDIATAPQLRDLLTSVIADRPAGLVIDLAKLTFVDPTGARPLAEAARSGTVPELTLRAATPRIAKVLELLGFGELFD